jgi:hypothetical protein
MFTRELIDDFFALMHVWPLKVKKSSNNSNHMQNIIFNTNKEIKEPKSTRNAAYIE